jgi:Lrp/AsnC family transcriptional regulator for asnA, asnC and gidA
MWIILGKMNETVIDKTDLKIINSLSRDSRIPYSDIASIVGISPNAVRTRVNKMLTKGVIQNFVVNVNPVIFGYEKECFLTIKHIDKTTKEDDILNGLNLLGDVVVYARQLGRASIFALSLKTGAEDKIGLMVNLLKPAVVESSMFVNYKPISMSINNSDFKIIKCLLSNPRMQVADIAKEASISTKTVKRRLEKMRENHILQFSILRDMSSMQIVGYIEFAAVINVTKSLYRNILERIYQEMQEYLLLIPNVNQNEIIFAVFFCANIPTVESILTRLESYDGVNRTEAFVTTKLIYYQEWLKREINKRLEGAEVVATRKDHIIKMRS